MMNEQEEHEEKDDRLEHYWVREIEKKRRESNRSGDGRKEMAISQRWYEERKGKSVE